MQSKISQHLNEHQDLIFNACALTTIALGWEMSQNKLHQRLLVISKKEKALLYVPPQLPEQEMRQYMKKIKKMNSSNHLKVYPLSSLKAPW